MFDQDRQDLPEAFNIAVRLVHLKEFQSLLPTSECRYLILHIPVSMTIPWLRFRNSCVQIPARVGISFEKTRRARRKKAIMTDSLLPLMRFFLDVVNFQGI